MSSITVLPRPGQEYIPRDPIPAPSEESFTNTFGHLLPPAEFIHTIHGNLATYQIKPSKPLALPADTPQRILLIHGLQTCALGLLPLAKVISKRLPTAHVVLFDHYGHGLSPTPFLPHTPSLFHEGITSILDHLQWSSAHIVGYSFGGTVLAGFLATYPECVRTAAFIAPGGLMRSSDLSTKGQAVIRSDSSVDEVIVRDWVFDFLQGGALDVPVDWRDRVEKGQVVAEAIWGWEYREHTGHQISVVGIVRDGGVFDNHEAFRRALKMGKRCLVVLGGEDEFCVKQDCEEVGFSDVRVIEEVGHGVVRERVEDVAGLLEGFWSQLDGE